MVTVAGLWRPSAGHSDRLGAPKATNRAKFQSLRSPLPGNGRHRPATVTMDPANGRHHARAITMDPPNGRHHARAVTMDRNEASARAGDDRDGRPDAVG